MFLLAGLGNPGNSYARHRHNIGAMAVDSIARAHGLSPWRRRFQSLGCEGSVAGEPVLVLKPQTFMNESGRAIGEALRFLKLSPAQVIILHDDLDLAPFRVRTKVGGGHGGHNGLRSISAHIGADYQRIRLGIGHPGDKTLVHNYVLGDFPRSEEPALETLCALIAKHVGLVLTDQASQFQNTVHLAMQAAGHGDRPAESEKL
jgi:PTH1 family peptidyl-tRNA hydrolase